ncbi:MAG: HD domain-containing protein [Candidatus Eisenbacteria sp.]|nr:HD domain-containing protein [Candidatus Eisenbacteria bacterium]
MPSDKSQSKDGDVQHEGVEQGVKAEAEGEANSAAKPEAKTAENPEAKTDAARPEPADSGEREQVLEEDAFFPVPLRSLQTDGEQDLRLYVRLADSDQYVPYGDDNFALSARHKEELEQRGVEFVFVAAADRRPYLRHMESHLDELTADADHLTPEIKASVVYECISQLTEGVLEAPQANADLERVTAGARTLTQFILARAEHFNNLLQCMASTYQLPSHATNACILGLGLGVRLGLSEEELTHLGTGLLLMDLGKAEIDRATLEKQSALSDEEWEVMHGHPQRGAEILETMGDSDPATLALIRQHHERCTGNGYPEGRETSQIHFFAKIAGLVDVFDALTTQRAYRQALESFPAVRVMQNEMREDFNPLLFRELIRLLGNRAKTAGRPGTADATRQRSGRQAA